MALFIGYASFIVPAAILQYSEPTQYIGVYSSIGNAVYFKVKYIFDISYYEIDIWKNGL